MADMASHGTARLCTLGGVVLLAATVLGTGQDTPFRAGVDLVSIAVTLTDRTGALVEDLRPEDFEVLEDGRLQTIVSFAKGDASRGGFAPPLHLGLLFDTSGSMRADIGLARTAAVRFLNTFPEAVDMALVDFASEVRIAKYGQGDFARMVERIRSREPGGETALYDALGVYLERASEDDGRTILVLYTDGGDSRSSISFSAVMDLVRASTVTIYAVGLLEHQSSRTRLEQQTRLTQIAEASGGTAFFPSNMRDIERAYDTVVRQIRAQYMLGFTSTNVAKDGRWRRVEVRTRRSDLRGARIRSRRGYFAPFVP
jgi:Ca-activated chloride channel homolog